jgi:membrane protein YqaA with SNARE-associated domain
VTKRPSTLARIIALLIVVGISIYIFSIRDQAKELAIYGYPGIFGLAFLSYATVLLPAPGVAVIFTMGAVFNPIGVAIAAGAGAALGEVFGYLAGYSGQVIVERADIYDRLMRWMKANGALTILLLSALPNPLFDVVGVIAGALKMPLRFFLFWCWIGETIKMLFFALAGSGLLN